jgi:polyisoprenoid-binding protein YceI
MTQLMTEQGMVRVPAGTWTVDPVHSSAAFEVKHMMIANSRAQSFAKTASVSAVRAS